MTTLNIDRRSNLSYAEFRDQYLMPGRPVIISNSLSEWPAKEKWTPEYFKTHFGHKRVCIEDQEVLLGDFIDEVVASSEEKPARYLRGQIIHKEFPEVAEDIVPDIPYQLPDRIRSPLLRFLNYPTPHGIPELLITGAGGRFKLHYDKFHLLGFVTQVYGDKEFTLLPPDQGKYLYPHTDAEQENWSQIGYLKDVDTKKFPLFEQAQSCTFVLRAGETLFNPQGWWHATRALTPSIAMVISTVNAANWQQFTRDFIRIRSSDSLYRKARNRLYYYVAGKYLDWKEKRTQFVK